MTWAEAVRATAESVAARATAANLTKSFMPVPWS
jgi:hypothetical protein